LPVLSSSGLAFSVSHCRISIKENFIPLVALPYVGSQRISGFAVSSECLMQCPTTSSILTLFLSETLSWLSRNSKLVKCSFHDTLGVMCIIRVWQPFNIPSSVDVIVLDSDTYRSKHFWISKLFSYCRVLSRPKLSYT
jgi:hypothetical protein